MIDADDKLFEDELEDLEAPDTSVDDLFADSEPVKAQAPESVPVQSHPADDDARLEEQAAIDAARRDAQVEAKRLEVERAKLAADAAEAAWREARKSFDAGDIDSAAESDAQSAYLDAKLNLKLAERESMVAAPEPAQAPRPRPLAATAQAWIDANPKFRTDPVFQARAKQEEQRLLAEGYDLRHPKFYERLDRRLKETPRMTGNLKNGAPVSRGPQDFDTNELPEAHKSAMQKFGLNPQNERAKALWVKNLKQLNEMSAGRR